MSENSFKSIRNGVITSVLGGIILLSVPKLREYLIRLLSWFWHGVTWCWEALTASYSMPGWAWLVIGMLSLIGVINIYHAIRGNPAEPEWKSYIEDYIFGAKWRWNWVNSRVSNLWCFCPTCDATLVYDDSSCRSYLSTVKKTNLICENCGHTVIASVNGGDKDYAVGAAERELLRRIRTGEYKNHLHQN